MSNAKTNNLQKIIHQYKNYMRTCGEMMNIFMCYPMTPEEDKPSYFIVNLRRNEEEKQISTRNLLYILDLVRKLDHYKKRKPVRCWTCYERFSSKRGLNMHLEYNPHHID